MRVTILYEKEDNDVNIVAVLKYFDVTEIIEVDQYLLLKSDGYKSDQVLIDKIIELRISR